MRTLVVSDLHLGSALGRDVLRRPVALDALQAAVSGVDRLVLLGDVVELLEGRPRRAFDRAHHPLRVLGETLGRGREVLIVPGNHDHVLVRPFLRERRAAGRALGIATRVPARSSAALEALVASLRPARVRVQYPGAWLGPGIYATHGHYVDRQLFPRARGVVARGPFAVLPDRGATPDEYERTGGPSIDTLSSVVSQDLPDGLTEGIDRAAGALRRATIAAVPLAAQFLRSQGLAPLTAGVLGMQFRRAALPAMSAVLQSLGIRARHVLFGHVHRTGPLADDDLAEWRPEGRGPRLHNSGSWVFEPLLLAGAEPPHPYWPGGAVLLEPGAAPRTLTLLDDASPSAL
ncbi:MAG: metallophosphoesterase family protein [Solirubrobacterales bacterium]|nr:metallophosphoesterase family protein [Solirubrobacterales bacterium]